MNLAITVQQAQEFGLGIYSLGALGPAGLADLGAFSGLFHALGLCKVRRR